MSRRYRCVALIALIATLAEGVDPPEQQPYILQTTTLSEVPVFSSVTGDNFDGVGDLDDGIFFGFGEVALAALAFNIHG